MITQKNEKILECILNMDMAARHMFFTTEGIKDLKIPLDSQVFSDLMQYMYIRICIVIDEFDALNRLAKEDTYLRETIYCVHPAIKGIRKYTGLKRARNLVFAHLNRDKDQFAPWWDRLDTFKLPRTYKEINQTLKLLLLINTIFVTRYYDEFKAFTDRHRPNFENYFDRLGKMREQSSTDATPLDDLELEVEKRCSEKELLQFVVDPAMMMYFEENIARRFRPRPLHQVMVMTDEEIRQLPEIQLGLSSAIARLNKSRNRPLTASEEKSLEARLIKDFRVEMERLRGSGHP